MNAERFDLILKGGSVFSPADRKFSVTDVGVRDGRIVSLGGQAQRGEVRPEDSRECIDCSGAMLTPGLVDLHTHIYWGGTPLGVNPDKLAPAGGVTAWVDMGSAGAGNFEGLYHHVIARSALTIAAFINLSYIGLVPAGRTRLRFGELFDERLADADALCEAVGAFGGAIKGIKLRIGMDNALSRGLSFLELALDLGEKLGLPVAVHATAAPPRVDSVLRMLRPGDLFTHCCSSGAGLLGPDGAIRTEARAARARGVRFDLGHGARGFSFSVAERACAQDFPPDFVSSDLHAFSWPLPVVNLPTTLAKMVLCGMRLEDALFAASAAPAAYAGLNDGEGSLREGGPADLAVLRWSDQEVELVDGDGQTRRGKTLEVLRTIRQGRTLEAAADGRSEAKWKPGLIEQAGTDGR
jgi:dihydroorotase